MQRYTDAKGINISGPSMCSVNKNLVARPLTVGAGDVNFVHTVDDVDGIYLRREFCAEQIHRGLAAFEAPERGVGIFPEVCPPPVRGFVVIGVLIDRPVPDDYHVALFGIRREVPEKSADFNASKGVAVRVVVDGVQAHYVKQEWQQVG